MIRTLGALALSLFLVGCGADAEPETKVDVAGVTVTVEPPTTLSVEEVQAFFAQIDATTTSTTIAPTTTTSPPATDPPSLPPPISPPVSVEGSDWDQWMMILAECESGVTPDLVPYGAFGFIGSSWVSYGGTDFAPVPYEATLEQQFVVVVRIVESHGGTFRNGFPGCARKLGMP